MIAAQSIGEPGTQLTMRTFHVGGTAQVKEESQIVAHSSGKIKIVNRNIIEDSEKNKIIMGRNTQISIEDENERQLAIYKVPYGAKLYIDNGETVKKSSGCGSSDACYTGRYSYNSANSDGGVIGPFTGSSYRIFIDKGGTSTIDNSSTLTVGRRNSCKYYSKD